MASYNKATGDVSAFSRLIFFFFCLCCTARNLKSVFIPGTFTGTIADTVEPVKNALMNNFIDGSRCL